MAKKSGGISLYLIGMIVVVVGCFLPLVAHTTFGFDGGNAFGAITDGSGDLKVAAILAFAGAVAGIIFSFVSLKGIPAKLIALIVSVAGGIYMVISMLNLNPVAKKAAKLIGNVFGSKPGLGLILIIIGWIIAIVGYVQNKD